MGNQAKHDWAVATKNGREVATGLRLSLKSLQQLAITQMPKLLDDGVITFRKAGDLHDL